MLNFRDGIPLYFSAFCGSGINKNNFGEDPLDSGCHRDTGSDVGSDKEVCFCKGTMCNNSDRVHFHLGVAISIFLLVLNL